jgi:hypothetical protein
MAPEQLATIIPKMRRYHICTGHYEVERSTADGLAEVQMLGRSSID